MGTNPKTVTVTLRVLRASRSLATPARQCEVALVAVDVNARRQLRYDSAASLGTYPRSAVNSIPPGWHDAAGLVIQPFRLTTVKPVQVLVDSRSASTPPEYNPLSAD
jgi:hypothetical protein